MASSFVVENASKKITIKETEKKLKPSRRRDRHISVVYVVMRVKCRMIQQNIIVSLMSLLVRFVAYNALH
jgi:hypothetical protein